MSCAVMAALSTTTEIVEIIILVLIIALLIAVLVLDSRRDKRAKVRATPAPQTYYGDRPAPRGRRPRRPTRASPPPPTRSPASAGRRTSRPRWPRHRRHLRHHRPRLHLPHRSGRPSGTPAGWLPDPGGTPDTLRYWDGTAWTEHLAARS